jgi:hypothetical protein
MNKTENKIDFGEGNTITNSPITQGSDNTEVNIKTKSKVAPPSKEKNNENKFFQSPIGQIIIAVIAGLIITVIVALFK